MFDLDRFAVSRNLTDTAAASLLDRRSPRIIEASQRRLGFTARIFDQHCNTALEAIRAMASGESEDKILTTTKLAAQLQPKWNSALLRGFIQQLVDQQRITVDNGGIRPITTTVGLSDDDRLLWTENRGLSVP